MEPKKNPKADLTRNSGLYFAIGLALVTLITWRAIEWKKYEKNEAFEYALNVDEELEEEIPITQQQLTQPPPPPPPAPEIIEVVEDEEEVEETVIESTETDQEEEIIEVEEVEVVEEEVIEEVPFSVIEDAPIFPGCEGKKGEALRQCFQKSIMKHINKNFRYPEIAQEMGIQGRVSVTFVVDTDGSITNVRMRGPDKSLEKEAARIISKLPKMTPGKQRGRAVRVPFSIPINFKLQ